MAGFTGNRAQFEGDWVKVLYHDSSNGVMFSDANDYAEAKFINPDTPNADKYSILSELESFRIEGKFTFKLYYPEQPSKTNIWSQTSNPVTASAGVVTGYTAIDVNSTSQYWGGLERSTRPGQTFLDGSTPHNNWWYAVGCNDNYGGVNTYPGPAVAITKTELWVKYKNV